MYVFGFYLLTPSIESFEFQLSYKIVVVKVVKMNGIKKELNQLFEQWVMKETSIDLLKHNNQLGFLSIFYQFNWNGPIEMFDSIRRLRLGGHKRRHP